jgi:hypothetical protein
MANISFFTQSKLTLTAKIFRMGKPYSFATELARKYNATIGKNSKGLFTVTFACEKDRDAFRREYDAWYDFDKYPLTSPVKKTEPEQAKGDVPDFKKALKPFAGKGKSANHDAADALRAIGLAPVGEPWDYWQSIR